MEWINPLERRFGRWAIPHLTRWLILFQVLGYILIASNKEAYNLLVLNWSAVKHGEVWRLVSYLFIPNSTDFLWIIFALSLFYTIGEGLEQEWGAFRLNLFYGIGMLGSTVAAILVDPLPVDSIYLNTSLFIAFATVYPDFVILVFMILPVKMKWLGLISGGFFLIQLLTGSINTKVAILFAFANYLLFFGKAAYEKFLLKQQTGRARARFRQASEPEGQDTFHLCVVCKRTELTNRDLHFRVAADGNEYCEEHLPKKG